MKKILIIVPDGGMLFESAGIADILMQANRLHPEGAREILPYSAAFTCMKGMTVIVLMWEEAAIKDDVIEYDIAFNIIYIMRTNVVLVKL
ncbi:TPA: hypothetical protein MAQ50_000216 [Klebsiella pneumoniae]|nr:hypothetical protein [Klebsiella pneumoniae]HBS7302208.1 hypothetical protein [Klebsiella pneumoniae]